MTDRTVADIILACQEQETVTDLELRHALLCLAYDSQMCNPADFADASTIKLQMRARENYERRFRMLKAVPATYLGAAYTPGTPENTEQRARSKRLLAKLQKGLR